MSCPVNLQALPSGVFEAVFTPENVRGRNSMNSLTPLSFPKSRSALWDGSPAGAKLRLHLCSQRKPRLVLSEKALRLAQRHARHSNKSRLHCFFLGSLSVDADEEGVTVTLDRFDPGRDQPGASGRVPSALLPGDVLVPCLFSTQAEASSDAVVLSVDELHHCFKVLQQLVSGRQTLDLSQLMKVRGCVVCSQQCDAAAFSLSWSTVCPSLGVDIQPIRAVPIIPTALLRSLTSVNRPLHATNRQRGFLTMDQTRKLLLLLESDPKASNLPLVGLWLSGVTHVYNPQVWAWCLRFLCSAALQDRVFSENRCFLLVLFGSTHRAPQFFQCRGSGSGPGPQLDYQLLMASQCVTLYQQVGSVEGQTLRCELGSDDHSRQMEIFGMAQSSFSSAAPPAPSLSVSDQDSGVEDEDLSPRPSPSPHAPAQQARRVQPSVPELSLLVDGSFTSTQRRPPPSQLPPPAPAGNTTTSSSSSTSPPPHPLNLHSTPNSNLEQPCSCCSAHKYNCTPIFPSLSLHTVSAPPPAASSHHHTPPPSALDPAPPPPPFPSHHHTPISSHRQTPPSSLNPAPPLSSSLNPAPPPPPFPSHHHTPTISSQSQTPPISSHRQTPPPSSLNPALPPAHSHHHTPPSRNQPTSPPTRGAHLSSHHQTPPPFSTHLPASLAPASQSPSTPPSTRPSGSTPSPRLCGPTPPSTFLPPPPTCPCSHPPAVPCCGDAPSHHPSHPPAADPASPLWFPHPSCMNQCCDQVGGVMPAGTYQLLLHQDRQLRLLQAQIQMLLEAQGKLQSASRESDTQTPRSTASVAVGTGASLFWGDPIQTLPQQEAPPPSTPPPSFSPDPPPSHTDLPVIRSACEDEDGDLTGQKAVVSPSDQHSGLQSPVLGESVSMYGPVDDQQNFYHDLMNQLTTRLQESDSKQEDEEEEEEEPRRKSMSVVSDQSQSTQSSKKKKKKQQQSGRDPVVSATLRQLQRLGVDVDEDDPTAFDQRLHQTIESSSTLAGINPAAVLSRLRVSEPTASCLFPGGSVDLSLEANAIALRYLSDSQLSRLSLGGHTPCTSPTPSSDSLVSPNNMSVATRRYMKKYGLIEEEEEEEEEEEDAQEALARKPLAEAQNVKLLPQSQLIRDLRPKMKLLAGGAKPKVHDKENCSSRRPSLLRPSSPQTEGSVGNILDLCRLRQLSKLF